MTADQPQRPEPQTLDQLWDEMYRTIRFNLDGAYMIELREAIEARAAERTETDTVRRLREALEDALEMPHPGRALTFDRRNLTRCDCDEHRHLYRALVADPPVPHPDPALAYAPDGSVVGRVIGWATKPDGRSVPILGPAPEPEPPAQTPGQIDVERRGG